MQRSDHRLELTHLVPARIGGRVARLRREVADGVVAPVVDQAVADELIGVEKMMHRHQLHRCHAQLLQMVERCGVRQSGIGSAQVLGYVCVAFREALDMQLVDDRVGPRGVRAAVIAPWERRIHHHATGHRRRRVERAGPRVVSPHAIPVQGRAVLELSRDSQRIGIQEQLRVVVPQALRWGVSAVDPVRVPLARGDLVDIQGRT